MTGAATWKLCWQISVAAAWTTRSPRAAEWRPGWPQRFAVGRRHAGNKLGREQLMELVEAVMGDVRHVRFHRQFAIDKDAKVMNFLISKMMLGTHNYKQH